MISRIVARIRSLWSGITAGTSVDDEMHAEFQHHIEMRATDLVKTQTNPDVDEIIDVEIAARWPPWRVAPSF